MQMMDTSSEETNLNLDVSASEEAKGGIKYEVLLEQKPVTPARPFSTSAGARSKSISAEAIELKIKAAAERRHSMEAERIAALNEQFRKAEEVAKKKEEEESKFCTSTKENLEQKIETTAAKRENIISDLKTKLSTHNNHLQEVRQNLQSNLNEFEEKTKQELLTKLEAAEKNREKALQEKLESLKKHDEKIEQVRIKRNSSITTEDMVVEIENSGNQN